MKKFLHILFFLSLFLITASAQDKIHRGVTPDRHTTERLLGMHQSNVGGLKGIDDRESLLLKSKSSNWQTALRNPQREFYEEEGINAKNTRTTINKTLLGNGFLLIEAIFQTWDSSAWVNGAKGSYTYDANNNLTELLNQNWDGSTWVNTDKHSYTYDGNNNQTEDLYQILYGTDWVNNYKYSYAYDGNNNVIEVLVQTPGGSGWVNVAKYSYAYDGNNNVIEVLVQTWDGSAWVNFNRGLLTYDGNNNQTESLWQSWDGSAWVNSYKWSYTYDGNNNQTEWLWQDWDGSAWINNNMVLYTYDGNDNEIEMLAQDWDGSNWVNWYKYLYTYDGNNNQAEWLWQDWDGSAWVNYSKVLYTYVPVTAVNDDLSSVNSYSLSNNYPNPFNPVTSIQFRIPKSSFINLKVYDVLGNEVVTLVNEEKPAGNYEITWNATNLSSGVYFYTINAGSFIETRKMILLK